MSWKCTKQSQEEKYTIVESVWRVEICAVLNRQLESPGLSLTLHQKAAEHHYWKEEVGYALTWVCFSKMRQMADTTMRMNSADDKGGGGGGDA